MTETDCLQEMKKVAGEAEFELERRMALTSTGDLKSCYNLWLYPFPMDSKIGCTAHGTGETLESALNDFMCDLETKKAGE